MKKELNSSRGGCFLLLLFPLSAIAQISITNTSPVTQNFNSMSGTATASLPSGWRMSMAGAGTSSAWTDATNATTTTQFANSGTPTTGGRYNWANNTERAIGFMTDVNYSSPNAIMAFYQNNTGNTIISLSVSFNIERYRINTGSASVAFYMSTDGTTWTSQSSGDVASSVFATGPSSYTFSAPASVIRSFTISNLAITQGGAFYFKWVFTTDNNASQGLGLDNVTVSATTGTPLPVTLHDLSAMPKTGGVEVVWRVASESNLLKYEVEKSTDGRTFSRIGEVASRNSQGPTSYSFFDATDGSGIQYYRLRLIDYSPLSRYSVVVKLDRIGKRNAVAIYPNPILQRQFTLQLNNMERGTYQLVIHNSKGQVVHSKNLSYEGGSSTRDLTLPSTLTAGMYFVKLQNKTFKFEQLLMIK